jgi:hypothetical protein
MDLSHSSPQSSGRAGRVVDLEEARVERLAEEIAGQLQAYGGSILRLGTDVEDVERWRRAARRAGRQLGVSIRTGVSDGFR